MQDVPTSSKNNQNMTIKPEYILNAENLLKKRAVTEKANRMKNFWYEENRFQDDYLQQTTSSSSLLQHD